jgi:hypothetical protein
MQRRAIDIGELSIRLIEEHRKISPRQQDRVRAISLLQRMSDLRQI